MNANSWVIFGIFGQIIFGSRFLIQWIVSEIKKKSVVPIAFWYLSIAGGIVLFLYALYRKDIVFILGQGLGLIIYCRNLILVWSHRRTSTEMVKEM